MRVETACDGRILTFAPLMMIYITSGRPSTARTCSPADGRLVPASRPPAVERPGTRKAPRGTLPSTRVLSCRATRAAFAQEHI